MMRFTWALRRRMLSSVTNDPFPPTAQTVLNESASRHGFASPYWFTLAQCQRSLGGQLKAGATPTPVTLAVEAVFPFEALPKDQQTFVLDQHPAYFASGVGILSHRYKWNAVLAKRLVQQLNPNGDARAFYVDLVFALNTLKFRPKAADIIDITAQSTVLVYNGDQMVDPFKAIPADGIALNAMTGKRLAQPAHDILLSVGIMRGYVSPYWVAESQIPKLNIVLREPPRAAAAASKCKTDSNKLTAEKATPSFDGGVDVATLRGTVVRLADIKHEALRAALLNELLSSPHLAHHVVTPRGAATTPSDDEGLIPQKTENGLLGGAAVRIDNALRREGGWLWLLYGANGWESLRSEAVVRAMYRLIRDIPPTAATLERCAFVNIDDTMIRRPDLAANLRAELNLQQGDDDAGCVSNEGTASTSQQAPPLCVPSFRLEHVTKRRYYNAAAFTKPHLVCPVGRPIAIVNGRLAGRRVEGFLRHASLQHQFSSPVWLTERGARLLGVEIAKGAVGILPPDDASVAAVSGKQFYNLSDVVNEDAVLKLHPLAERHAATAKNKHYLLEGKWRPVLGVKRRAFFNSLKRSSPLWVSAGEVVMSGLQLKPHAIAYDVQATVQEGVAAHRGKPVSGERRRRVLYNSAQTSDPVRVIGRVQFFSRPQVLKGNA